MTRPLVMGLVDADQTCDRCGHTLKQHDGVPNLSSRCLVGARSKDSKDPRRCLCDSFVPAGLPDEGDWWPGPGDNYAPRGKTA